MTQDPNAPLLNELRWLIRQRWIAGGVVLFGVAISVVAAGWGAPQSEILPLGVAILFYNLVLWRMLGRSPGWLEHTLGQRAVAWVQITLDLMCLTLLVLFTGGLTSPLLALFVLHMIFASLLLQQPRVMPYLAWALAIGLLSLGFWSTGHWPRSSGEYLGLGGWGSALLLTVYITTHITKTMQINDTRTRGVLAAASDGILTIDSAGRVEMANPAAYSMLGYQPGELIGLGLETVLKLESPVGFTREMDDSPPTLCAGTLGGEELAKNSAIRKDGSWFPVEVSLSRMNIDGRAGYSMVVHDITQRQETESTLRRLNSELSRHQAQLIQHEKMVTVGRMAAGIAHEIANPLANIDGLIQLVERNPDRLKAETPGQLKEQVVRINHILRQLKDFAHPADSDRRVIPIEELIRSSVDLIHFDRRARRVTIKPSTIDTDGRVYIHVQSIEQVLVNLLVNALDASDGTNAEASSQRVVISSAGLEDGRCRISIEDNGVGISDEDQERIFEPFFTTKPLGEGTGLGLSISYNLVEREGGHIQVKSSVGVGTTVSVYLPLVDADEGGEGIFGIDQAGGAKT